MGWQFFMEHTVRIYFIYPPIDFKVFKVCLKHSYCCSSAASQIVRRFAKTNHRCKTVVNVGAKTTQNLRRWRMRT